MHPPAAVTPVTLGLIADLRMNFARMGGSVRHRRRRTSMWREHFLVKTKNLKRIKECFGRRADHCDDWCIIWRVSVHGGR